MLCCRTLACISKQCCAAAAKKDDIEDNVKNEIIAIGESTARILQIKKRENKNPKQKSCKKSLGPQFVAPQPSLN